MLANTIYTISTVNTGWHSGVVLASQQEGPWFESQGHPGAFLRGVSHELYLFGLF